MTPRAAVLLMRLVMFTSLTTLTTGASADEVDGRVTGRAELRTMRYREARTDVLAPSVAVALAFPRGTVVRAHYLADVITSASVSVDAITSASLPSGSNTDTTFAETRHEGGLGARREFAVGARSLAIEGSTRLSFEPDYRAYAGTVSARLALDERATAVSLRLGYAHDEVREALHDPSDPLAVVRVVSPVPEDDFDAWVLALEAERIVTPRLVLRAGYELGLLRGYLSSPYRRVAIDGFVRVERLPDARTRHTLTAGASLALPRAHAGLHADLRLYADDWAMRAVTLELRYHQAVGSMLLVRLRQRAYVQRAAFFDSGQDVVTPTYYDGPTYATANPRYAAMQSLETGLALVGRLGAFAPSRPLLEDAEVELGFDYRLATTRYGHAQTTWFVLRLPLR